MLSSAIVVFREILELSIIVGVLLAATRGLDQRLKLIWSGVALGVIGSCIVAFFAETISAFAEGMGQELFNASVLILASLLIGWTVVWMKRHARVLAQHLKRVAQAVSEGDKPLYAITLIVMLSTLREGSEIVLFTFGILVSGESLTHVLLGSLGGLAAGSVIGGLIYYGIVKISTRRIFTVTSWLLIFLASGMMAQALGFLQAGGFVIEYRPLLWDTSGFLSEQSLSGQILHSLVGYTARPSGTQVIGYVLTVVAIGFSLKVFGNPPQPSTQQKS